MPDKRQPVPILVDEDVRKYVPSSISAINGDLRNSGWPCNAFIVDTLRNVTLTARCTGDE